MNSISIYLNFLKKKGISLSDINIGSEEYALNIINSLAALNLLKDSKSSVLGGDILTEENNKLMYAYQIWGDEFISLNWYCEKIENESKEQYLKRSYNIARSSILEANKIAEKLNKKCFIVLVTE